MDQLMYKHIYRPPSRPGAPTLLLLHGTGGDERDLLPLGDALSGVENGVGRMGLLSLRGDVLERGMPRFFRRLAEGVFDEPDIIYRAGRLAAFIADASTTYGFDCNRVIAAGFSNGANIATAILLIHPGVLSGALLFSPMTPLVPAGPPDLAGTPVFIAAGQADSIAPASETERLVGLLRQYGTDVDLHWYPGGHGISAEAVSDAGLWLDSRAHVL